MASGYTFLHHDLESTLGTLLQLTATADALNAGQSLDAATKFGADEQSKLASSVRSAAVRKVVRGVACSYCGKTGHKGKCFKYGIRSDSEAPYRDDDHKLRWEDEQFCNVSCRRRFMHPNRRCGENQ